MDAASNLDPASEILKLREENARLVALVAELQEKLAAALAEIERLGKDSKGRVAPFSRGKRKQPRKKPGRKPGQGRFVHRPAPDYANCDVTEAEARLQAPVCVECGGLLGIADYEEASTTEMPPTPRPQVKKFRVEVRRCTCCRRLHRGTHPDLKPDQFGATAHRVGPGVYAHAHWLHYGQGLPVRRLPALLRQMLGIPLTQGAITQDALRRVGETRQRIASEAAPAETPAGALVPAEELRRTGPIGKIYLSLRQAIPLERVVYTDDTSWGIDGLPAWLMVFGTLRLVVYQIRERHRNEEVREILVRFRGVMVCDRGSSYEALALRGVRQQKCLSHLIRNITAVLDYLPDAEREKAELLLRLLREALACWHACHRGDTADYAQDRQRIIADVDRVLEPLMHVNPCLHRLLNGIGQQHDRGHLLRFLEHPEIEPTNNRAERDLRPAVIARKVSQCSRTAAGAEAHAAWSSVIATLARLGVTDPVRTLVDCIRSGKIPGVELPAPSLAGPPATC